MSALEPLVLVIEDEAPMRRFLRAALTARSFRVAEAGTAKEGVVAITASRPDVVLLDLGLPDADGIDVARGLRGWTDVPIIVLSARGRESDKVAALDAGADDYLTKPFGVRELVARARALLRRPRKSAAPPLDGDEETAGPPVRIHGIEIDPAKRRVRIDNRDVELTDQEFRLLHLLATHAGIVFSREALLARIWRGDTYVTVRSVDTLVKRLRRRIESDPAHPRFLLTVWGVGYKFADV
jgi:two-component system KDP operon response regulator KdpE